MENGNQSIRRQGYRLQQATWGFLPVNDSISGIGEGFVKFTMGPQPETHTEDSILAQASIVFDDNESISTNLWRNFIDAVPPASQMNVCAGDG